MSDSQPIDMHEPGDDHLRRMLAELESERVAGIELPVNCRATMDRLDGDLELFRDLVGFYFSETPELVQSLKAAIKGGDADAVRRLAHRIKGMLANFNAEPAVASAALLESLGRNNQLDGAAEEFEKLERANVEVARVLTRFRGAPL